MVTKDWIIDSTRLDVDLVHHARRIPKRAVLWVAIDRFSHAIIGAHVELKGGQS